MYRKLLNKNSFRFLKGAFTENPIFFKKLNRKALFYNTLSNKRGLTDKIRKIQKNIIKRDKELKNIWNWRGEGKNEKVI